MKFQTLVVLPQDVTALKFIVSWGQSVSDMEYVLGERVILITSLNLHRLNLRSVRSVFSWRTQIQISLMDFADSFRRAKRHGGT